MEENIKSQDNLECNDFKLADDTQIENMQREYSSMGIGCKNQSRLCSYPLPIYMTDKCFLFCKYAKEVFAILNGLDKLFVSRNKNAIDFISMSVNKNSIDIALKGNITQEIFMPSQRMPIKQSMYRLLELFNHMTIILSEISSCDKSMATQQTVLNHMMAVSVLQGLCI